MLCKSTTALACDFILGLCLGQFVRGCAYAGGNGFYLFAKASLVGAGSRLVVVRHALGLTVAARQNIAYARTTAKLGTGHRNVSHEPEVWVA